jgi:hypothetical protein
MYGKLIFALLGLRLTVSEEDCLRAHAGNIEQHHW